MSEWVNLTAADGHELKGYVATPEGTPRGGVVVVHSSVVASHGLSLAFGPLNMLQNRLITKINCAVIVMIAA